MAPTTAVRRPRRTVPVVEPVDSSLVVTPEGDAGLVVPDEVEGSRVEEVAPKIPEPTISERVKDVSDRVRGLPDSIRGRAGLGKRAPRSKAPRGPRQSVDRLIGTLWGVAARVMQPVSWPVANVLHAQAPVAGMVLEDVVRGTVVDTVLQPFAKIGKGGEVVMALIGPPLLVGLISAKPETAPVAIPLLKESLRMWLDVAGPKLIEHAEREKKFQEEYGSTIDEMISMFFTPPTGVFSDDNGGEQ